MIDAKLDLNLAIDRLLESTYGLIYIYVFIFIFTLLVAIYFVAKSGLISEIKNYLEYRNKSEQDRLKNQENLLNDSLFENVKSELEYHFNIEKIQKYLKFKHYDIDLLFYIISCRNKKAAIKYYESAGSCLEKDQTTKKYKLKSKYTDGSVKVMYWIGTIQYFVFAFASLFPTFWVFYIVLTTDENLNKLPNIFFGFQFLLSLIAITIGLFFLTPLLKPWKAKQFLELEKVKD